MSSYQKFTKSFSIITIINALVILERLIFLPLITKRLGAISYGIWAQFGITLGLATTFCMLGLPGALVRFLAAEKERKEIQEGVYSVLAIIFAIGLFIALPFTIFSPNIANFFQSDTILVRILGFTILFECLNLVLFSILKAFQQMEKYAFFMISEVIAEVSLISLAIFSGYGINEATTLFLAIRIGLFLILFFIILRQIGIKAPKFLPIRKYLSFGLPQVGSSAAYWVVTSSDRYLIGLFLGTLFVGYYSPSYSIGNFINFYLYPFAVMLPPVLAKLFDEKEIDKVKTYLKYCLKYFLLIAVPSVFGLSFLSKQFLLILSTQEIAENAFYVTPFIALSILLYGISSIYSEILSLVKKTKTVAYIWFTAAILNLIFNIIFIPHFGILSAAIDTLVSYSFAFFLTWYFSFKELRFEIDWKFIIKSILASILMILFIIWFNPTGLSQTLIAIILGALLYGILIFLLKGFSKKEIEFLKEFLKRFYK